MSSPASSPAGPYTTRPDPPVPHYRQEASLYAALAPTALQYGRTLLDTLHERVGEEALFRGNADLTVPAGGGANANGVWTRLIGMRGDRDGDAVGIYGSGPTYHYSFAGLQLGVNLLEHKKSKGSGDNVGVYGAIGRADTDVDHFDGSRAGTDQFTGYSFGGYWTHFGPTDWYVDGVLQLTYYDATANSERGLPEMKTDGFGLGASIEGGYPFKLDHGWVVEPQLQFTTQTVNLKNSSDIGADVSFDNVTSLTSRLGVRVARTWEQVPGSGKRLISGWARLSAWHEYMGDPETSFSSATGTIPFRADLGGSWWELKSGVTAEITPDTFVYASVGYQKGFDADRSAWDGKIGVRILWK